MVTREDLQATCDDIVREFSPLQVILFGSYAYGTPTEDSDVDLLVVMDIPESETRRQAVKIRQRIPRRFSMDLLVRSPEEIAYRVSYNDWFLREITENGEVLYGCANICKRSLEKKKSDMNPLTLEWIQTAEGDYASARHFHQAQKSMYDIMITIQTMDWNCDQNSLKNSNVKTSISSLVAKCLRLRKLLRS